MFLGRDPGSEHLGEGAWSIQLALGAAVLLLGFRVISLVRAEAGVTHIHERLVGALGPHSSSTLRARIRRLGYQNPYAALALELLHARDLSPGDQSTLDFARDEVLDQLGHWAQRGHALDLVGVGVLSGLSLYGARALDTGPLQWAAAGLAVVLLLSSVAARARLAKTMRTRLLELHSTFTERPSHHPLEPRHRHAHGSSHQHG